MLSSREQNKILYQHCPTASHDLVRVNKANTLQKLSVKIIKKSTKNNDKTPGGVIIDQPQGHGKQGVPPISTALSSLSSSSGSGGTSSAKSTTPSFDPRQNMFDLAQGKGAGAFQANRYIIENKRFFEYDTGVPPYRRPPEFHPKQNEIADAVLDKKVKYIFVEGTQRAGKNTAIMAGLHETVLTEPEKTWQFDIMVGKGKHAQRMLRNMANDRILKKQNEALLATVLNSYLMWFNGSRMDAHDTTVADIKGADCDIGWVDEFDVAIKKDPKAVMSLIFTMRANKNLKAIFSANVDRGMFVIMQDLFKKKALVREDCAFFSIYDEDAPHIAEANNDEMLSAMSDALCGTSFTRQRLGNEVDGTGDQFDIMHLNDSYDIYETFCMTEDLTPENMKNKPDYNILGIDPSNTGHPFGYYLGGVYHKYLFEIKSGMMKMGLDTLGQKWTPDRINLFFYKMCKDYNVSVVVIENNTYGAALQIYLKQRGINAEFQSWAGEGKSNSRSNFLSVARAVYANHVIANKNLDLKPQLVIYDPIERDKVEYKGDIADAHIHFIWKAVGGLDYMRAKEVHPSINRGAVR